MDKLLIAATLLSLMLFTRCESEYQRQMSKAESVKELIDQSKSDFEFVSSVELKQLEDQIELCATVSGSKQRFLKDLYSK